MSNTAAPDALHIVVTNVSQKEVDCKLIQELLALLPSSSPQPTIGSLCFPIHLCVLGLNRIISSEDFKDVESSISLWRQPSSRKCRIMSSIVGMLLNTIAPCSTLTQTGASECFLGQFDLALCTHSI